MNYSDFGEIIEDEFTGSVFGKKGQLIVLGWVERQKDSYGKHKKIYALKCSVCELDPELFGDGLCRSSKSNLTAGRIPCGCAFKPTWTTNQWEVRISRKLDKNHKFLGLVSPEKGAFSKVKVQCKHHGLWDTGTANAIMHGQGCRLCANGVRIDKLSKFNSFEDSKFTENFYTLGGHSREIIFTRISARFWSYTCNVCGEYCETRDQQLYRGSKSCVCSGFAPKQAYINIVLDNSFPVAIKFGVSVSAINRKFKDSVYDFHLLSVWDFDTRRQCMSAEAECKEYLDTGIISKLEMPDGYTETTYIHNIENILNIYQKHGGKETMRNTPDVFST